MPDVAGFRQAVDEALKKAQPPRQRKDLASKLGVSQGELSHRINAFHHIGRDGTERTWSLTPADVFQIVEALISWKGITSRASAENMLTLMEYPLQEIDWQAEPWKRLHTPPSLQPPDLVFQQDETPPQQFPQVREEKPEIESVLLNQTISRLSVNARGVLLVMGLLSPRGVELELLQQVLKLREDKLLEALAELEDYDLLKERRAGYQLNNVILHMHVKNASLFEHTEEMRIQYAETIIKIFLDMLGLPHETQPERIEPVIPHILELSQSKVLNEKNSYGLILLLWMAGDYLLEKFQFEEAESLHKNALAICEEQFGITHRDTVHSLASLAKSYMAQGKYEQAELHLNRALDILKQTQTGEMHTETMVGIPSLLGLLYLEQKKYTQAEVQLKQALAICEKELGDNHPKTASCLNDLAKIYIMQKKYDKAEPLLERALAICEKELEDNHPKTALCLNNLAEIYIMQRKHDKAEPLVRRALTICEKELGDDHPETASCLNNLAEIYTAQKKYDEAERLLKRALAIWLSHFGKDHPDTLTSLNNLAMLYHQWGKYGEAFEFYHQVVVLQADLLGQEHPDTARTLTNLGEVYYIQRKYRDARQLYRWALEIQEPVLGPEHPDTKRTRNNLEQVNKKLL